MLGFDMAVVRGMEVSCARQKSRRTRGGLVVLAEKPKCLVLFGYTRMHEHPKMTELILSAQVIGRAGGQGEDFRYKLVACQ